ncbi:Unknown protein, partial [Striga hermonthica]
RVIMPNCSSRICKASWGARGDCVRSGSKVHGPVLEDVAPSHGDEVGVQYSLSPPDRWSVRACDPVLGGHFEGCGLGPKPDLGVCPSASRADLQQQLPLFNQDGPVRGFVWTTIRSAQERQKVYADRKRQEHVYVVGDHVFLKVSPMGGVIGFGKKGKLRPRYIRPFEILDRVGDLAYRLALPPDLSGVHDVFHVSMLQRYVHNPDHVVNFDELQVERDLTYEEVPAAILDRKVHQLRNRAVSLVKVQWSRHDESEATWEKEAEIRRHYPNFEEDETIDMYYARFCDLVNQSAMLGEPVPEARQVQKLMRTLPDRFGIKITTLESFQRIQKLGICDLLSKLRTFEINHSFESMRISKGKGLALKAKVRTTVAKDDESHEESFDPDEITKALTVLTKGVFGPLKVVGTKIQQFRKMRSGMQLNKFWNSNQGVEKDQCRECKGFGHFQKECPNLKKKNNTFKATWSDSSDDEEEESEKTENSNYLNNFAKWLLNEYNCFTSPVHLTDVESDAGSYAKDLSDVDSDEFSDPAAENLVLHKYAIEKCIKAAEIIKKYQTQKLKMKAMERKSAEREKEIVYLRDELQKMRILTVDLSEKIIKSDLHIGKQDKDLNSCFAKLALVEHGDKLNKQASEEQNFTIESL